EMRGVQPGRVGGGHRTQGSPGQERPPVARPGPVEGRGVSRLKTALAEHQRTTDRPGRPARSVGGDPTGPPEERAMTPKSFRPAVEFLEPRDVPSGGAVRIAATDPFAGSTADDPATQPGVYYPHSQVEPAVAANPDRANNVVAVWQQDRWSTAG